MTVEEIKQNNKMIDVVRRYGIEVNAKNMCSCPFHGEDRHPSMKIYDDSFYCFTCSRHGDIFSFVMYMDNVDFKTAFYQLGGKYDHEDKRSQMRAYRAQRGKETKRIRLKKARFRQQEQYDILHTCQELLRQAPDTEVFTPLWCGILNRYHEALWEIEEIETEINEMRGIPKPLEGKQRTLEYYRFYEEKYKGTEN